MATAAAELLRTLPQPQVTVTVGYSLGQKLALIALCLRQAGLERTLSVLEREAAVKGVDMVGAGAGASAGAGAKAGKALAEADAASLEKHTALCLAELQREAAGGAVAVACVLEDPAPRGAVKKAHEPPPQAPRPSPKPKPSARAAEAHTLDDILGDDVDYSDEEEDAGDTRREDDAKPPPAAASHEPPRKSRETPQRSEPRVERAVGIEPPRGAAPRPTWGGHGKEPKPQQARSERDRDRDREREPARGAPPAASRDWPREPAGWERGRAELPRHEEPRRDGPPRGGPGLPPPPPLPAGRMSGGRGPPLLPPPPPPPPPHYGRQAPLPPPPPPKRQRY